MNIWQDAAALNAPAKPADESLSFHQRYYQELVELVERRLGDGLSGPQKDFQIAMLAIRSSRPDAAKALVFSPDVQRLKQERGEAAAMTYLRQLMEAAQRQMEETRTLDMKRERE